MKVLVSNNLVNHGGEQAKELPSSPLLPLRLFSLPYWAVCLARESITQLVAQKQERSAQIKAKEVLSLQRLEMVLPLYLQQVDLEPQLLSPNLPQLQVQPPVMPAETLVVNKQGLSRPSRVGAGAVLRRQVDRILLYREMISLACLGAALSPLEGLSCEVQLNSNLHTFKVEQFESGVTLLLNDFQTFL
jgi:hypothetical protein